MKKINTQLKNTLPHLLAIFIISVLVAAFFAPAIEGKTINSGDDTSSISWNHELTDLAAKTGKNYNWNNSMFSGMPWNMIAFGRDKNLISYIVDSFDKIVNVYPVYTFLKVGILCYLAFVFLGVKPSISLMGAILFTFSINFIVVIGAGHQSKVETLAFLPLILSGIILAFRSKYLLAFIAISIGMSGAILGHHVQMIFYFMISTFFIGLLILIKELVEKKYQLTLKAVGVIVLGLVVGLGSNYTQLFSAQTYAEDTMRGQPILKNKTTEEATTQKVGLDWPYAMSYSTEAIDFFTLFVPGFVGGSLVEEVRHDSELGKLLAQNNAKRKKDGTYNAPLYWGSLPGSYSYYVGALSFLFLILFFLHNNKYLVIGFASALTIIFLFALGSNAEWFNRFLFDHLPLFSKFRAPSSALTVIPVFFAFSSVLAIHHLTTEKIDIKLANKKLYISVGIAAGLCLFFYLFGTTLFSFVSQNDQNYQAVVKEIFINARISLFKADLLRTMFIILTAGAILWAFLNNKIKSSLIASSLLVLLVTFDMWNIDKRYLDEDNFVTKVNFNNQYTPTTAQQQILNLEPKGRGYYRVLNQGTNTYNDALTSYHFSSVGGYSPIKLRRYQDLIEYHLSKGNVNVFNMLNTKYIINNAEKFNVNTNALGNAWFVNNIINVNSPDEEIEALNHFNPKNDAIILSSEFENELKEGEIGDGTGTIELTHYEPGNMIYKSKSNSSQLAVFSEVWYGKNKGWDITINGVKANMLRANYLLRALFIPQGENEIIFTFKPKAKGWYVSIIFSMSIILAIVYFIYNTLRTKDVVDLKTKK